MAQQIVVPLKSDDRTPEILPSLEEIARPGMMETGMFVARQMQAMVDRYCGEGQR